MVTDNLDIAPRGWDRLSPQAANIFEATILKNLNKGNTVSLSDNAKLATFSRSPAYVG
jgi:hypothetical protein